MAIIPGTYFECDQCGKIWAPLKRDKKLRCPNQNCRSTRWNSGKSEVPEFSYVLHSPAPAVPKQAAVFVPESGDGSYPRYDVMEVMKASSRTIPSYPVSAEGYQVTKEDVSRTVDQYLASKKS